MNFMTPWKREKGLTPSRLERSGDYPLVSFQKALNNLFDDFFRTIDFSGSFEEKLGKFDPRVDMVEDEKEIRLTAELPGLDEKNIELQLSKDRLIIKGEKSEEKEEKDKEHYYMERSFGSFQRMIALPTDVDSDKIDATFEKGVLHVTMPKVSTGKISQKKIPIKSVS